MIDRSGIELFLIGEWNKNMLSKLMKFIDILYCKMVNISIW